MSATQLLSPITPFLSEYFFQNLRNGLSETDPNNKLSIHFTDMPSYSDDLIDHQIEDTVESMQNAIEVGRLLRSRAIISMKYPLAQVKLINADQNVLDGYAKLESYIKAEINCVDLVLEKNEAEFVQYTVEADNRALGKALGKKFDKAFKAALPKLTNDQVKGYLRDGVIDINGNQITEGMLKVVKSFTAAVKADKKWACESKGAATVMLDTHLTPELKRQGLSREITNRIQRLRKESGISIEDQIDVYYEVVGASPEINATLDLHGNVIREVTRMPLLPVSMRGDRNAPFIGETEFTAPDDESEHVKMYIYLAQPEFNDAALQVSTKVAIAGVCDEIL